MTEEFDNELANADFSDADSILAASSVVNESIVPPESSAEEAFAAAANSIAAAGGPVVVDPYAVLNVGTPDAGTASGYGGVGTPGITGGTQTYVAPGYPVNRGYGYGPQFTAPTDGFAIAALVCGIAGIMMIVPIIGSILGVIFGIIALHRIGQTGHRGRGLAWAGVITGAASLLLGLLIIIGGLTFGMWTGNPLFGTFTVPLN
jgi:hypothetical protein